MTTFPQSPSAAILYAWSASFNLNRCVTIISGWRFQRAKHSVNSVMWPRLVTHDPYNVICLWISKGDTANSTLFPSPTKTQRPHCRVASKAKWRPWGEPEQSMVTSQPCCSVRLRVWSMVETIPSTTFNSLASKCRSAFTSEPKTDFAPRARASTQAARPTGPRPITSTRSLPLTFTRVNASQTVPNPQAISAPSTYVRFFGSAIQVFSSAKRYGAWPPSRCHP